MFSDGHRIALTKGSIGGSLNRNLSLILFSFALTACQGNSFNLDNIEPTTIDFASSQPPPSVPATRWKPAPGLSMHIQYSGTIDYSQNVDVYNIDLFDTGADKISALKARGVKVICYFSGGSFEDWRSDAKDFPTAVLGKDMQGWAGEKWLDIRQISSLMPIMKKRIELAKAKGCDAVDPDNMDGYSNDTGWQGVQTYAHQIAYNKAIAEQAHALGLSVGLKNDLEQIKDLADVFDFAVNESCMDFQECDLLKGFSMDRNKAVFAIDYHTKSADTCSQARALKLDIVFKGVDLDAANAFCN